MKINHTDSSKMDREELKWSINLLKELRCPLQIYRPHRLPA